MHRTEFTDLTDDALVARVSTLCAQGYALTARLIVLLIEVEERRLDLRSACTSMFDYCQRRLGMSEGTAFRRITAARLVKRFPTLLGRIERGEIHLSTLVLLRPHLDEQNVEELATAVVGKTKRQVEELLARLAPKPDMPSAIVELGAPLNDAGATLFSGSEAGPAPSVPSPSRARIEPLSEARYGVQLTANAELKAPSAARTRRRTCASAAARTTASPPKKCSASRTSPSRSTFASESPAPSPSRSSHRLRRKSSSSRCAGCTTSGSRSPTRVERWTTSRTVTSRRARCSTCNSFCAARSRR